jgi:co-chaperonin GroES (HSP10)
MAIKLTPLNDRVIARRFEAEETAKSGIVLPDVAKEHVDADRPAY